MQHVYMKTILSTIYFTSDQPILHTRGKKPKNSYWNDSLMCLQLVKYAI